MIDLPISIRCIKCNQWKDPAFDQCRKVGEHTWICGKCKENEESNHNRRRSKRKRGH